MNRSFSKIRHIQILNEKLEDVHLNKKILNEQPLPDYGQGKKFSEDALRYIESLGGGGFTLEDDLNIKRPTKATKGDIKVYLINMNCTDPKFFGVQVYMNDQIWEGCKGSNVTSKLKPQKETTSSGRRSRNKFINPDNSEKINKDISVIIDELKVGKLKY
jgi:hypothetical protein